jgi:predicted nucleic acid-binding protein
VPAVLVDAGPLVALIDRSDAHHAACVDALKTLRAPLISAWPPFTEAMYLLHRWDRAQDALWALVESGAIRIAELSAPDVPRLRALMQQYKDQPMDLADAALVRIAEREGIKRIFTLDRRHFTVYRIGSRGRFAVVP